MISMLSALGGEVPSSLPIGWLTLVVLGFVLLVLILWLVQFAFRKGKALATFFLGLVVALVVIGWVLPSGAMAQAAHSVEQVVLKPYYVAREWPHLPRSEWLSTGAQLLGWAVVNAAVLGVVAYLLLRDRKALFIGSVAGVGIATSLLLWGFVQ